MLWQQYGLYFGSRHLIFGLGTNGFNAFSGTHTYTHGNFSEVLCDFGLIGFLLYYSAFIVPLVLSFLSNKKERFFVITVIFVLLIDGFLSVYYYDKTTFVLLAVCYYSIKDLSLDDCLLSKKRQYFNKNNYVYCDYCQIDI